MFHWLKLQYKKMIDNYSNENKKTKRVRYN